MQLDRVMRAYKALNELMDQELDYKSAHSLIQLKRELEPHAEFFAQLELQLVQEYGEKEADGVVRWDENGMFRFADLDAARQYENKRAELCEVDIELPEIVTITAPERIRPAIIEALDQIVKFEGE